MAISIYTADPTPPALRRIIAAHVAHGDAAYPSESNHHLSADDYASSDITLFAAWDGKDCLGMLGILPVSPTQAEVKSMHVLSTARGRGVGTALLDHIMKRALESGVQQLLLETGSRDASAPARRLYERAGFTYCPPFGSYLPDPESVFMQCYVNGHDSEA